MGDTRVRLLLVDDDPTLLDTLERALVSDELQVFTAESGLHALQVMEQQPIDIVLSDELMPGMPGVVFLETVAQRWPACFRVLVTGHAWPDTLVAAVNKAGVRKVVVKPFDLRDVVEMVATLVAEVQAGRGVS
jgi:DNA-binding NtrC family response regulator